MYERFTERARKVMQLANMEAQRLNHKYFGTEHILLGLVKEGSGVAASVLKNLRIDLREIRLEIERLILTGPKMIVMGRLPQTPRAKQVIVYSLEEARNLKHRYTGTEHLLLGLIQEGGGIAVQVLRNLEVDPGKIRREVEKLMQSGPDLGDLGRLPQTPRFKKAVDYAIEEALALEHDCVGTEHLLLGLLREQDGVAAQVLMNICLGLEEVRQEVKNVLQGEPRTWQLPLPSGSPDSRARESRSGWKAALRRFLRKWIG